MTISLKSFTEVFDTALYVPLLALINKITLTHLFQMHPFSPPWKHLKTVRFSDAFRGQRKGAFGTNGLVRNIAPWKSMVTGNHYFQCSIVYYYYYHFSCTLLLVFLLCIFNNILALTALNKRSSEKLTFGIWGIRYNQTLGKSTISYGWWEGYALIERFHQPIQRQLFNLSIKIITSWICRIETKINFKFNFVTSSHHS